MSGENNNNVIQLFGVCDFCKHQRAEQNPDCILCKDFSFEKEKEFHILYNVFGYKNTIEMLNSVSYEERDTTAKTLILEAKIRLQNPVHGAFGYLLKLQAGIDAAQKELEMVNKQLEFFKGQKKDANGSKSE